MNNNHKKSIAKLFGPVLLLTGALALPADLGAAPTPKSIVAAKPDKDQKKEKQVKQQKAPKVKQNQGKSKSKAVQQQAVRQKQVQQKQVQKEAKLQRQAEVQRQAELQAARQRVVVVPRNRTRFVARPYAYRTSPYYRDGRYYVPAVPAQGRGGRDRSVIAADGYLDASRDCLILRGHEGQVYSLVGDNGGLQEGDHVRLLGRLTYDRQCGAQALEVTQVQAIWADRNHRQVYFDHQTDGSFNRYDDRYGDDRDYDDRYEDDRYDNDQYYDDRYDNRNDNQLIIREGRLYNLRSSCPVLQTDRGEFFLNGDVRNFGNGDKVKVTGFLENGSRCGGNAIRVGEITRR